MRKQLLSEHIQQFPVWGDLAESVDRTWETLGVDSCIEQLKWLRSPINVKDVVIGDGQKLLSLADVPKQDRTTLVQTADLLGFRFYETNLLTAQDYLKLCINLAEYYGTTKGSPVWTEFLSWCLNTKFVVTTTWTRDYRTFLEEGDPNIGMSIELGGEWYPTTHIVLEYDMFRFQGVHPHQLVEFFNYFANVNVVLWLTQLGGTAHASIEAAAYGTIECEYAGGDGS
jgi:hypothetical protein